jgi:drug/metabolite transporter (DMT)-like permease
LNLPIRSSRWKAIAAGSLAVLFWGASFVWIKAALRELEPITLLTLRFTIGSGVVWLLALRSPRGRRGLRRSEVAPVAGLGLLGIAVHQGLQTAGMQTASASTAAWMASLAPAFIVLLAWPILGERVRAWQAIGLAAALVGAGLVSSAAAAPSGGVGALRGTLLVIASAVVWALYSVLGKAQFVGRPPLVMTAWSMTFGWLALCAAFIGAGAWTDLAGVSIATWRTVVLLGVASTGLAYGLYFYALSSAEAALAAALQYLEPLVTMALAGMMLGERMTVGVLFGGGLILGGVWLVDRAGTPSPTLPLRGGGQGAG